MQMKRQILGLVLGVCLTSAQAYGEDRVVLTTTDFSSGSITVVGLETRQPSTNVLNVHSDAAVQVYNGKVYVINRLGQDNILVLDPGDLGKPERQFSVGNGTNPQGMAFIDDTRAYVTRYESAHLLVVNPATGDSLGSVDLSGFADADGVPETLAMAVWQERVYILCQRLDRNNGFVPTDRSEVAVVDVKTDALIDLDADVEGVQGIVLALKNPVAAVQVGDRFFLSCTGLFTEVGDGGIEVVDLGMNASEGNKISELDLGGNVGAVAMVDGQKGYMVVTDESFTNSVKPFDLSAGTVGEALVGTSGGFIPDIGVVNNRLYVADQDPASAGLLVYDTGTNNLVAGPLDTGLPPSNMAFILETQPDPVAAADFSGDGRVDFTDFLTFVQHFDKTSNDAGFDARIDLDGDGQVGFSDFLEFAEQFGKQVAG